MEMGAGLNDDDFQILQQAIDEKLFPVDVIAYVKYSKVKAAEAAARQVADKYDLKARPAGAPPKYLNRVRVGGIKL